jgi:hypothetical protein
VAHNVKFSTKVTKESPENSSLDFPIKVAGDLDENYLKFYEFILD